MKVTKLQAGQQQLESAIRMFFREEDEISTHTLAAATHEVLWGLAKKRGAYSLFKNNGIIPEKHRRMWEDTVAKAPNFFKHGLRDPDKALDFNPEITEDLLFDSTTIYRQVAGQYTPCIGALMAWYLLAHRGLFASYHEWGRILNQIELLRLDPSKKRDFLRFEEIATPTN